MVVKPNSLGRIVNYMLPTLLGFMVLAQTAGAIAPTFYIQGYTYDETGSPLNNTNVTIEIYQMGGGPPMQVPGSPKYASSNETGYFNATNIPEDPSDFYRIILKHFNDTNLDYIGQQLPMFPFMETYSLSWGPPINFYLRPGGTINITAINETGASQSFKYQVKDTKLGYPIAENWDTEVTSATVYVPAHRNYSIMIYPNQSFPVSYDLNNLTSYSNYYANIIFRIGD